MKVIVKTIRSWAAEDWVSFLVIAGFFVSGVVCEVIGVVKAS